MKRGRLIVAMAVACVWPMISCQDPYTPRTSSTDLNYLVIEGGLNTNGPTTIQIKRTNAISQDDNFTVEGSADVRIEGDDGTTYALPETGAGRYSAADLHVDLTHKFRLKIRTSDQKEYESDFVPVSSSPPIDTLKYTVGDDVQFLVTTHDPANNTRYYRWNFVETWLYSSQYPSEYVFDHGTITARGHRDTLYYCWQTRYPGQILLGSSAKLERDYISDFPVTAVDIHSDKFQNKYSILVEQFALTREAYEYWDQLKKNTESLGSIFDPQPSQNITNIHSVSNPFEPVVGYFSAGSVQRKRIFISTFELPNVRRITGYESCKVDTLFLSNVPSFDGTDYLITAIYDRGAKLMGYEKSSFVCVDCRLKGGTTERPDFWE